MFLIYLVIYFLLKGYLLEPDPSKIPHTYQTAHFKNINCFFISGYLLEPDTSKRPDIYQVAHFAFLLSGKRNPVLNTNVCLESVTTYLYKYMFFFLL